MIKGKGLKISLICFMLLVFTLPLTLVGCNKGKGNLETPNSQDVQNVRYKECVEVLKTSINNIETNNNDVLNGFGIYIERSGERFEDDGGEVREVYFESIRGEDYDTSNYFASYYLGTDDGEWNKHYTLYSANNNFNGTKTYVMKNDYEECILGDHAEYRRESLTEMATVYLYFDCPKFSEEAVIGWYESFEDKNDFSITCKYDDIALADDLIIKYTVEDGKLVMINAEWNRLFSDPSTEIIEIKYGIEVDAYDKYNYARKHIAGLV